MKNKITNEVENEIENEGNLTNFGHTITIIVLIIIIAGMLIGLIAQYSKYTSKYVTKESIEKFYIKKSNLGFSDLPQHIRILYISKVEVSETEKRLNDSIKMIERSTITARFLDNISLIEQVECNNFKPASYETPNSCKDKLVKVLAKMNDNMIFEIIPMVNNEDFNFIQRIVDEGLSEEDKLEYKDKMHNLMEYANRGLSHYRTNEAIWMLKQHISKSVKIRNSSFHMFTKDKAGFIIKIFNYIE